MHDQDDLIDQMQAEGWDAEQEAGYDWQAEVAKVRERMAQGLPVVKRIEVDMLETAETEENDRR